MKYCDSCGEDQCDDLREVEDESGVPETLCCVCRGESFEDACLGICQEKIPRDICPKCGQELPR